jgi:hypothetical protein
MISIQDSLRSICTEEEYVRCRMWAECEGYPLVSMWPAEESLEKAKSTKEDWLEAKAAVAAVKPEEIPTFETSNLTIRQLHAYLSRLLLQNPEAENMSVQHVEFGNLEKSTEVKFDKSSKSLYIA